MTQAFKEKKSNLFIAADLGHYIADAHMPLHTSDNRRTIDRPKIHSLGK
jgi:hypothetical protein